MKKANTLLDEHKALVEFHDAVMNAVLILHKQMPSFQVGLELIKKKK